MWTVIVFFIFATVAVIAAINLVVQTHPISSALSLIGVMISLAVLYLLLGGEFIAAAQVIVYAGAIMVLFVFVIMLLNAGAENTKGIGSRAKYFGLPLLIVFLGIISYIVQGLFPHAEGVVFGGAKFAAQNGGPSVPAAGPHEIGTPLFTTYLLPFEVVSVLILIALVGAIVLARKEVDEMSSIPLSWFLILSAVLFSIGIAGFIYRRNIITIFMSIELMLNAVNLSFIAFSYKLHRVNGHIFSFFVMVVAAAEAAVGLAIILTIFKNRRTLEIDEVSSMKY